MIDCINFDQTTCLKVKFTVAPFRKTDAYPLTFCLGETVLIHFPRILSEQLGESDRQTILAKVLFNVEMTLENIETSEFIVAIDADYSSWVKNLYYGHGDFIHASCTLPKLDSAPHVLISALPNIDFSRAQFSRTPSVINESCAASFRETIRRTFN
jgi:hypothetical protein